MIIPFKDWSPTVGEGTWVAPDAWVIGDVTLGEKVSIFFGAVLRGDILGIRVGRETNIQEHCMIHTSHGRTESIIGDQVTVGHRAIIHGATVGSRVLVGMGSIILDQAVIEDQCVIGAGTVVTEGKRIPARSLVVGVPGKVVRTLSDEEVSFLTLSATRYYPFGQKYDEYFKSR
jgi:carbonic anhydrase/acetyltransferase-like protein (isoleucine patch superfamily)